MFRPFSLNIGGSLRVYPRPQVMGIVNITPDSFYSKSRTMCDDAIKRRVEDVVRDGADFLDIGAYSSRPGASDVSEEEELERLRIGLNAIRSVNADIPVSVDTFRSRVAYVAVKEFGANIINDISGGDLDRDMFSVVAALNVPYILMHMRGNPQTMQRYTDYENIMADMLLDMSRKLRELHLMGVSDVIVDPGFGFSKTLEQNYEIMRHLDLFSTELNAPVLVGVSRKSMITKTLCISPDEALNGTTVLNTIALMGGAAFLRVHDVKEAVQAVKLYELSSK